MFVGDGAVKMARCSVTLFILIVNLFIGLNSGSEYNASDQCPVSIVTSELFANAIVTELRNITLQHCHIEIVDKGSFTNMGNLKFLSMFNNSIVNLDVGLFEDNLKLEDINLCANKIRRLEKGIFAKLVSVTRLVICNNSIETIEDDVFEDMTSVETLSLSGNQIVTLNANMFSNNKQLQTLKLAFNYIQYLNESIFHNLYQLRTIHLYYNRINTIEKGLFTNLQHLEMLNLAFNAIQKIDDGTFEHNTNLKRLWLNNNQISHIGRNAFSNATTNQLKELYLQHNRITAVSSELFSNFPLLEIISLSKNAIKQIDDGTLEYNKHLNTIRLSNNQISHIGLRALPNTTSLKTVYISANKLEYLNSSFLDSLRGVTDLSLYKNPWFCNCRLMALHNVWKNLRIYNKPYCTGPAHFRNVTWDRILSKDLCPTCRLGNYGPVNSTVNVTIGENVNFTCTLCAQGVRWLYRSDTGHGHTALLNCQRCSLFTEVEENIITSRLTITQASIEDGGQYTCQAVDADESREMNFQLIIIVSGKTSVNIMLIVGFIFLAILLLIIFVRAIAFVNSKCTSEAHDAPLTTLRKIEVNSVKNNMDIES